MKRIIVFMICILMLVQFGAIGEGATDDYSWLDDLTIKQLRELDDEIHKRVPYEAAGSESSEAEPQAEKTETQIDITAENFRDYFNISAVDTNCSLVSSGKDWMGIPNYKYSGNVDLTIEARYPCEIHNVTFNVKIQAYLGAATGSRYVTYNGAISQSGSYSSTQSVSWETMYSMEDHITVMPPEVISASGYIVISE